MEGAELGEVRKEEIRRAVEVQREFFAAGGPQEIRMRLEALGRLENGLMKRREEVLAALERDLGKPEMESFLSEYYFVLQEIRLVMKRLRKWLKRRRVGSPFYFRPCRSWVVREAFGVVLVIAPWNYPIQLSLAPLISAVAAGNTVILKPSEMAPASGALLGELLGECFAEGHVRVIHGGKEVVEELLERAVDFVFFTGSTEVGRIVAERAARDLTPVVLELGGKCPCVVEGSADLGMAARRILTGKLFNGGQTCFAPDFVAVAEEVREELVEELRRELERRPWEDEMARIVNGKHYERLLGLTEGKEIRKGEDRRDELHMAPRILVNAAWDGAAMGEEVFGPILPVVSYSGSEDLVEKLRKFSTPLAFYIFSRSDEFIEGLLGKVRSGSVCINDTMKQACNLELPFGGAGASGHGRYRGRAGVEMFTMERAVTKRYFVKDLFEVLPPRGRKVEMMKRWMR